MFLNIASEFCHCCGISFQCNQNTQFWYNLVLFLIGFHCLHVLWLLVISKSKQSILSLSEQNALLFSHQKVNLHLQRGLISLNQLSLRWEKSSLEKFFKEPWWKWVVQSPVTYSEQTKKHGVLAICLAAGIEAVGCCSSKENLFTQRSAGAAWLCHLKLKRHLCNMNVTDWSLWVLKSFMKKCVVNVSAGRWRKGGPKVFIVSTWVMKYNILYFCFVSSVAKLRLKYV